MPHTFPSRWLLFVFLLAWTVIACNPQQPLDSAIQEPLVVSERDLQATVTIYHPDPRHLWNRLFAHFYVRTAPGGTHYGQDSLDPLLWPETTYLLDGPSHHQALALLDEFLAQDMEIWLDDPLKRALMQRDMWAVFDWTTLADTFPDERRALQKRLAAAIQKLALSRDEIKALPDNYQAVVASGAFPVQFQAGDASTSFVGDTYLPPDLFAPDGKWLSLGREGGPMAAVHVSRYPFLGRSTFLIFVRLPDGREASENFVQTLSALEEPGDAAAPPYGTELALARQMMLIDDQGEIVLSPLLEKVQLQRRSRSPSDWLFYELTLNRAQLFTGASGGLQPLTLEDTEFPLFNAHALEGFFTGEIQPDVILPGSVMDRCSACHSFGVRGALSISRHGFGLPNEERVVVRETTPEREAQFAMAWKQEHESWTQLEVLLSKPVGVLRP